MNLPGDRNRRLTIQLPWRDGYGRLQTQNGRGFPAHQSLGREYRRDAREGDGGPGGLSQRRGRAGGAGAFLESTPGGGGEARGVRRLSGEGAQKLLTVLFTRAWPSSAHCARASLVLVLSSILLNGCGGHQQAHVHVPPPPPISQPAAPPAPASTTD